MLLMLGKRERVQHRGAASGDLVVGVSQVREIARQNGIPSDDEYSLLLQHMIISHHGLAEHGSPRPPMFPKPRCSASSMRWTRG